MKKIISVSLIALAGGIALWWFFPRPMPTPPTPNPSPSASEAKSDITIIAFGDSLTAGYGLPAGESYPAQLETALQARGFLVSVINAGVSGETTRGNLERAMFVRNQNPDIVLLGIGGNDALRFLPITETRKNMAETISVLQGEENPPTVFLLTMQAPLNAGTEYKTAFDALYEELSQEFSVELIPFITETVFLNPDYKLQDGIHLNRAGYGAVVTNYLLEPVADILTKNIKVSEPL